MTYLSYLMGAGEIMDNEILGLGAKIHGKTEGGSRKLEIPEAALPKYKELIREKLAPGFWNEMVGERQIFFIFKFSDGAVREYVLSPESEKEIDGLCAQFNNDPQDMTANVYKYISGNEFYRDFMLRYYRGLMEKEGG